MKKGDIKTVEMVRQIRERHYELLKEETPEEQIAFYRKKARRVLKKAKEKEPDSKQSA